MPDSAKTSPDLGSLQRALQRSLLRCPSRAEPPELAPLLLLPLPPPLKLRLLPGARLLRRNLRWDPQGPPRGLEPLRTALNILEKYGRNLLSPRPPRHWRSVSFGNPVYRATVGAIRGGRAVLMLLGYTEESGEGLSFPPPPRAPLPQRVAAVTADVLVLRAELERLLRNEHPNPQFFTDILLGDDENEHPNPQFFTDILQGDDENEHPNPQFFTDILQGDDECPLPSDPGKLLPAGDSAPPWACPGSGRGWHCRSCSLFNPAPAVLCAACERPRLAPRLMASPAPSPPGPAPWPCPRCTFLNPSPAPSCHMCAFPRASACDVTAGAATPTPDVTSCSDHAPSGGNTTTSCAAGVTSCSDHAPSGGNTTTSCAAGVTSCSDHAPSGGNTTTSCAAGVTSCSDHAPSGGVRRQQRLREDGRRLAELLRAAEAQGVPPEALGPSPLSQLPEDSSPARRLRLFRLCLRGALRRLQGAEPPPQEGVASALGPFSLAEAAWAWLEGEGRPEEARCALIGRRRRQLQLLSSLGCPEPLPALLSAFRRHRGSHWGALRELQRRRLRPFLRRHFRGAEPGLDFNRPDQQALVRQILATLPVASWGRALLVAGLARELGLGAVRAPSAEPLLRELLEAVGACAERAALRRRLRCDCSVCGAAMPRQRAHWLPGCSCPLCPECFRLHFSVGVRERGVGALGCPSCGRPDLRDEGQRLCYWSVLEPQLRRCLDPDTFGLVTQKLTELELQKDPQFLWCPQCSFGFIFEGERGPARCPQCQQSCCPHCQLPWDPRHASLSCAEFGAGLGPREPLGLRNFLEEPRIQCPECGQRFALARGGCLHFQCSQCGHQFCAGCGTQFHPPGGCPYPECPLRGSLHGHHPRLCLFYLRDWEPARLQGLLRSENITFETEPLPDTAPTGPCPVLEQKEQGLALRDEPCGRDAQPGHAGLCRIHYTEYLVWLLHGHGLGPAARPDPQRPLADGRTQQRPSQSEARGAGSPPRPPPTAPNMGKGRGQKAGQEGRG